MHPRNRYLNNPPDFHKLAEKYPPLARFLSRKEENSFNAQDPEAMSTLINALFVVDFDIPEWQGVPEGYLLPSITRSLNYLHFLEDLLVESKNLSDYFTTESEEASHTDKKPRLETQVDENKLIYVLDVGVGASCVFPLLGCSLHENWKFVGLDIDEKAISMAKINSKKFQDRIEIRKAITGELSRPKIVDNIKLNEKFHCLMCNPPFFSFEEKNDNPRSFGGTSLERWCEGGEVAFVSSLIEESKNCQTNILWFTSMLGKKESIRPLLKKLNWETTCTTIRTFRLDQGNKNRWVIAWSFFTELGVGTSLEGEILEVSNLEEGSKESLEQRRDAALSSLHYFTPETGICGGDDYNFRIRVNLFPPTKFQVSFYDIKGNNDHAVRSVKRKIEQDMLRTSRKWRKKSNIYIKKKNTISYSNTQNKRNEPSQKQDEQLEKEESD